MLTEDLPTRPRRPVGCTVAELGDRIAGQGASPDLLGGRAAARATRVTGITLSSQRVVPGDLYAALPGSRTHGIAYLRRRAGGRCRRGAHRPGGRGGRFRRRPRRRGGAAAQHARLGVRPRLRRSGAAAHPGRHHRHPGQDDHDPAGRGRPAGGRRPRRRHRHRRHPDRRSRRRHVPDHARGARPARAVRADGRARRRRLCDGGLQPRAGDGPRRRCGLRRRRLHQPGARPPRLPRRPRGLLPRQGIAVHPRAGAPSAGQRRRRARSPARGADPDPGPYLLAPGRRRRLAGGRRRRVRHGGRGSPCWVPTGSRVPAGCPLPGDFNVANALAAVAACAEAGYDPAAVAAAHRVRPRRAGPAGAGRRRPGLRRGRRLRPQARRGRGGPRDAATAGPRAADRGARRRWRPRPRQAAADGRGGRPARRPGGRHRRQPAHRGPRRDPPRRARRRPWGRPRCSRSATGGSPSAVALDHARPGDIVLVAGKGHETGQEIAGTVHPFDDRVVVAEELAAR